MGWVDVHSGSARRLGALSAESLDLAVGVNLVVLENGHLNLLSLVLDLLGAKGHKGKVSHKRSARCCLSLAVLG